MNYQSTSTKPALPSSTFFAPTRRQSLWWLRWIFLTTTLLTIFVGTTSGTGCACDDDVNALKPSINVTPSVLSISEMAVGDVLDASFTIGNNGSGSLELYRLVVEAGSAELLDSLRTSGNVDDESGSLPVDTSGAAFILQGEQPRFIGARQSAVGTMRFAPTTPGIYVARLRIESSDEEKPTVFVDLLGVGGPPRIAANPNPLDFGVVNENAGAARVVILKNTGNDVLNIGSVSLAQTEPGSRAFSLGPNLPVPISLRIGESISVEVRAFPDVTAINEITQAGREDLLDTLIVQSNAIDFPTLQVPITAKANLAPIAKAVELVSRRSEVKVNLGREVVLDGAESFDPEGDPLTFSWSLVSAPPAFTGQLGGTVLGNPCNIVEGNASCPVEDGFLCTDNAGSIRCRQVMRTRMTPTEVGTYTVRLRVTDDKGAFGEADVQILPRDLAVILRWNTAPGSACLQYSEAQCDAMSESERRLFCCGQNDLDLHLVKPNGSLGDYGTCADTCLIDDGNSGVTDLCLEESDANAATCRQRGTDCAYANRAPEWGIAGRTDDPRLDIDDPRGFGPEAITLDEPEDGTYTAAVHYFTDRISEDADAFLEIYVKGELIDTVGPQRLTAQCQTWLAASLVREGGPIDGTWQFVTVPNIFDNDAGQRMCR